MASPQTSGNGAPPHANGSGKTNGGINPNLPLERLFNATAEQMVLGSMLIGEADAAGVFDMLDPGDFGQTAHQIIFRRMKAMHKKREPIDRITLTSSLMAHKELEKVGGLSFVVTLDDGMPTNPHPERYAVMVKEASARRLAMASCDILSKGLVDQAADPAELLESHRDRMARITDAVSAGDADLLKTIPKLAGYEINTQYLLEGLIVEGALTLLTGSYGVGKSTLAMGIGSAIARGVPFLGRETRQRAVIVVDRENGINVVKERMDRLGIRDDRLPLRVWGLWGDLRQREPPGPDAPELLGYVRKERPLLIWDSLVAFARCDENSAAEMRAHLNHYRRLAAAGATCIILHHASEKSESAANYRGSTDIPAAVDTAYQLSRDDGTCAGDELGRMLLKPYKTRISPGSPIRFEHTAEGFLAVDAPQRSPKDVLMEFLRFHPGARQKDLVDMAKRYNVGWRRCLEALEEGTIAGKIERRQDGKRQQCKYYLPEAKPYLVED